MEIFILILSSFISLLSPIGFVSDKLAENAIRSQFKKVEQVDVRIDNAPLGNIASGKVDRLRVATRGLFPLEGIRIEAVELETDPINVSFADLRKNKLVLQEPLGVGLKLVIRGEDVIQALKSPLVTKQIQKLLDSLGGGLRLKELQPEQAKQLEQIQQLRNRLEKYRVLNPKFEFLGDQRFSLEVEVEDLETSDRLKLAITSGFELSENKRITLIQPVVTVNGAPLPDPLVEVLKQFLADQLDLQKLEAYLKIQARVLKFSLDKGQLELVTFIRLPAGFRI